MSCIYKCDYCNDEIKTGSERVAIQIVLPGKDQKHVCHLHVSCYNDTIRPVLFKKFNNLSASSELITWDTPRVVRGSKYFTPEVCKDLHRYILCGASAKVLSDTFNIPYQVMRNYLGSFAENSVGFKPTADISTLDAVLEKYKESIGKVCVLVATGNWSLKDIRWDCDIPEDVWSILWDNLPWFIAQIGGDSSES